MDMMDNLNKYVLGFGTIIITVIILSLVLIKFKTNGSYCPSGYIYNSTADYCALSTNQSKTLSTGSTADLVNAMDTSVTAFQEPANWIVIVVIGVIGVGLLGLFVHLLRKKN